MGLFTTATTVSATRLLLAGVKLVQSAGWEDRAKAFADLLDNGAKIDKAIRDLGLTGLAKDLDDTATRAAEAYATSAASQTEVADARALFDQIAPAAVPVPDRLAELGLKPGAVLAEMLTTARATRGFHETPLAETFFTAVLTPVLDRLLNDPDFTGGIEPALWRQALANDKKTHEKLDGLKERIDGIAKPLGDAERRLIQVQTQMEIVGVMTLIGESSMSFSEVHAILIEIRQQRISPNEALARIRGT